MASYNKVLLMGNLTRDVELKSIAGGQSVGNFGLAVNRRYTTQSGEKREEVTFIDCEAWGKTAENLAKFFSKGRPIFVEGRLKLDTWEKEGQKHSKLRVVIESFEFVDSKPGGGGGGGGGSTSEAKPSWSKSPAPAGAGQDSQVPPDDIPF
ncbi:MAG: single-stranded DNA-binding protein [Phycisphaerae bacterium]|nr:MAG: single-stranded DNA-binding protein [Phycisphaerae bacterium]